MLSQVLISIPLKANTAAKIDLQQYLQLKLDSAYFMTIISTLKARVLKTALKRITTQ